MTEEKLIVEAYKLIRRKANEDFFIGVKDETLGAYVRGAVDLQKKLWDEMQKEKPDENK